MDAGTIYREEVRSSWTSGLFTGLAVVCLVLFARRLPTAGWRFGTGLLLFLGAFFLFCLVNYRTLVIRVTGQELILKFGLVGWNVDRKNIRDCRLDDPPIWIKYGGAGVHFAMVKGQYRAFFNFLEGPRVLLVFREKRGPVAGLCFSTLNPGRILELLGTRSAEHDS